MIKRGSQVEISYSLTVDGKSVDKGKIKYTQGEGEIFPKLEEEISLMKEGEKKTIVLTPDKAFGEWKEEAVKEVPLSSFSHPENIPERGVIEIEDPSGAVYSVTVKEKKENSVILDFNHPLAGKTLTFEIELLGVTLPGN